MLRKLILALSAAILACAPAQAQTGSAKTPAALNTEVNSFWQDNSIGGITPFNSRQTLLDIIASYANISVSNNIWTGRQTFNYTPVFDLAGGLLGINELFTATNVTVPANANYSDIRLTQPGGGNNTYTIGALGFAMPIYSSPEALVGSSASSNAYGGVLHGTNDGPGNVRGAHLGGFANSGSTGTLSASALQIQPVSTSSGAWGGFASLTSSGANDIAIGFGIESTGDRYQYGIASSVNPVSYNIATYQAWMATGSSASARAFTLRQNDGTEIAYISKVGVYNGPSILLNGSSSGTTSLAPSAVASGVLTLPAATDTLVGQATTDTLTNKTISGATLSGTTTASGLLRSTFGVPTIASGACGATTNGAISGTNQSGIVTIGAAATTTCTVSYSATLAFAPGACVIFPGNAAAAATGTTVARAGTPSTSAWVITGSALANTVYSYICL